MNRPSTPRKRRPPIPNLTLAISIGLWVLLSWVGYQAFSVDQAGPGLWGCEMAYMYPSFHSVDGIDDVPSRYTVYLYREAGVDPSTPSGHPVIFVPGNAGSYKQARSVGGSAAAQFHAQRRSGQRWSKNIDLFTVDFNEDFSALHAPTLRAQGQFLADAIPKVMKAYEHLPHSERPSKVTLLGHSMGGIVARLAVELSQSSLVDVIMTMSTPHLQPPAALDYEMERIYSEINAAHYQDPAPLLISICGGTSDVQIVSDACALSSDLVGPNDGFAVFSTGIPGAWTGVEHQAMVWCDQIRIRVARTLLDMSESVSRDSKLAVARKWLLGASEPAASEPKASEVTRLPVVTRNMSVLVKLGQINEDILVDPHLTALFCRTESDCSNQAFSIQAAPWLGLSERPFPLLGEGSRPEDSVHVLDFELPADEGWVDLHHPQGALIHSGAFVNVQTDQLQWKMPKNSDPPSHLALQFKTPKMSSMIAYRLTLETERCSGHMPTVRYVSQPGLPSYEPSVEIRYYPLRAGSVILHSHISGSPFQGQPQYTRGGSIDVYQHPDCHVHSINLSMDPFATLAKAMLRLRLAVLAWCVAWAAVVLYCQLSRYSSTGTVPSFNSVIEAVGPRLSIGASCVAAVTLIIQQIGQAMKLPADQLFLGLTQVVFLPVMLLAALWSWGTVLLFHVLLHTSLRLLSKMFRSTHQSRGRKTENVSNWIIGSRVAFGLLLVGLVGIVIPYRLALAILFVIQFTLTAYASADGPSSRLHFLESILLLMALLLPFNLPALAVWGKTFWIHGQHAFPEDRAILPIIPSLVMVLVSSLERPLSTTRRVCLATKAAAAFVAMVAFAVAPRRPFVLTPTLNIAFFLASFLMFSPTSHVEPSGA